MPSLNDISLLSSVYNNIETQIRSLENFDVKSYTHGPPLIPMLRSKLPN